MAGESEKETVVIFPFMAQGHLIPFLALAFQIQQRTGYTITFVNTPLNIQKLRSSLPSDHNSTTIRLVELPFCSSDHGLPPNAENTDALPYSHMIRLLEASRSLKPSFHRLISDITHHQHDRPPLCIVADMFLAWTIDIAEEFGIFHTVFSAGGAYGVAVFYSLWSQLPHRNIPTTESDEIELPDFPQASPIHTSQLSITLKIADGTDACSVFFQRELSLWLKSDGILLNTVEEFDRVGLEYFRRKTSRPVWAIGPTLSPLSNNRSRSGKEPGIALDRCIEWLDTHDPNSVLYVSFGSQNTISESKVMELAMALEASGRSFIWVVRPPFGFDVNGEFRGEAWLPEGFEDRMMKKKSRGRGLLVRNWAPQLEILSHKSTCAFLSHCGWNSVLEALSNGVPIIGWPLIGEQFYNAKFLEEEMGVCVEVARGIDDSEVRHEQIEKVIELVMNETDEKGKKMRRKACEVKEMIKDAIREDEEGYKGSSVKAMDDFFNAAKSMRKTKEQNS